MPLIARPYVYTNQTVIDAIQLDANLDVAYNLLNGNLDEANIKSDLNLDVNGVFNVKSPAYKASGSSITTTGSINAGSNILTLGAPIDFANGQGINIAGNKEASSLQITSPATASANVTVTLNGTAFPVAVLSGDTAIQVADKIRAATYAGWTAGGTAGTDTVTFTSLTTGVKTDATYSAGTTGAAGTMSTTTQGSADLITTISSGAGTLSLTLAVSATTTVSGNVVSHNDTVAFQLVSAAINAAGGGKLIIPKGTYIVGLQDFAGATGQGYAYRLQDIINISNCDNVEIECSGAIFKMAAGLKFGSFDPVTGAVYSPTLPFTNADYQSGLGYMIKITDCNSLLVHGDLELDGNMANITLGGLWGDAGRQISAYGIYIDEVPNYSVGNVYSHHHCLDGIRTGVTANLATDAMTTQYLLNVRSEYNARQGFTIEGTNGLTLVNCKGNHTGKATFSSSPAAGLDFEPPTGCVARNVTVINCEFANNVGMGMVADSGDSADVYFYNTQFYGTSSNSIWPKKPRFKFFACLISGEAISNYISPNEQDRTLYRDCLFSADETFQGLSVYGTRLADFSGENPIFDNTVFSTLNSAVQLQFTSTGATYRNCRMIQNGSTATASPTGSFEGYNIITMTTGTFSVSGLVNLGRIEITGTTLGLSVANGQVASTSPEFFTLNTMGSNGSAVQANTITWGYQAPSSGARVIGDKHYNLTGSGAGFIDHWRCVTSGTPGTWVPVQGGSALTTISFAPDAIGFFAVVAGVGYMSVGTSSSADWKQITN